MNNSSTQDNDRNNQPMIDLRPSTNDRLGIWQLDGENHRKAIEKGCRVVNLPNYNTFFVFWVPPDYEKLSSRRIMVLLHGTNSNAYEQLLNFSDSAAQKKIGLVSIQWYRPEQKTHFNHQSVSGRKDLLTTHIPSDRIYEIMGLSLNYMEFSFKINKHHSAWFGTDSSASYCISHAAKDKVTMSNLFKLFIAVSGKIDENDSSVRELMLNQHNSTPLHGKNFYLWCGKKKGDTCAHTERTGKIIEDLGGTVQLLRKGSEGHDGFNRDNKYQLETIDIWERLCLGQ